MAESELPLVCAPGRLTSRSFVCVLRKVLPCKSHLFPVQVTTTISRGRVVWHDDKLLVKPGSGRYVPLPPGGRLFDGLGSGSNTPPAWLKDMQNKHGAKTQHALGSCSQDVVDVERRKIREEL
jgi:hypothetical protein